MDTLIKYEGGERWETVWLAKPSQEYEFTVPGKPKALVIDPDQWLLDHSKDLAGELDEEMKELEEDLRKGLGEEMQGGL